MGMFDSSGSQASQHNSSAPSLKASYKKGDFIGQKYEVYGVLGEGGFGIVYLVYSHELKNVYALKTFKDEFLTDIATRERFKKEAQVWIDLERHPYLVRAYIVQEISGRLYIAMEHIASDEPGMNTVSGYLRSRPPDLAQTLKWAIQFCYGMEHAYSKGVKAHRDIKPANIMIDQNKNVKISDFGLAGVLPQRSISGQGPGLGNTGSDVNMQTIVGSSIGTPEYMSPEQFDDLSACDERSDIYSFGIVLYQMASGGKLPFSADNPALRWSALKHFHQETPIPKLSSPLYPIIQKCLEKDPGKRYQTFREMRADLEPLLKLETGEVIRQPELKELVSWEWNNKGASLDNLGYHEEALECFDRAIASDSCFAAAWNNKGICLEELQRYGLAIKCFDTAIELDPKYPAFWNNKANSLKGLGSFAEALIHIDRALKLQPKNSGFWSNKGNNLNSLRRYKDAINCFDVALQLDTHNKGAWYNKANSLFYLCQFNEAIECCREALEIDPLSADVLTIQAACFEKAGNYNEAVSSIDAALRTNPFNKDTWYNKGLFLVKLSNFEGAILCFDKALEIESQDPFVWYSRGTALMAIKRNEEAVFCFDRVIDLDPGQEEPWNMKGICLENLGRFAEAGTCFEKALRINPKYDKARHNRARVLDIIQRGGQSKGIWKRLFKP